MATEDPNPKNLKPNNLKPKTRDAPMPRQRKRSSAEVGGFTLFELMLVLAVLVMLASLSWPAIEGILHGTRLRAAGDQIRGAWGAARVDAVESGEIVVFRFALGGNQYRIERWAADADASLDEDRGKDEQRKSAPVEGKRNQGAQLPEGIDFAENQTLAEAGADQRAAASAALAGASAESEAGWSAPIVFYPDGTASGAQVILKGEGDVYLALRLRGVTGGSTASELLSEEELTEYLVP